MDLKFVGPMCFYYPDGKNFIEIELTVEVGTQVYYYKDYIDKKVHQQMNNFFNLPFPSKNEEKLYEIEQKKYAEEILNKLQNKNYYFYNLKNIIDILFK